MNFEGFVKLAKRWNDEEAQQVIHVYVVTMILSYHQIGECQQKP
jgi:hypothetical protein